MPFESLDVVSYSLSIVTMAIYDGMLSTLQVAGLEDRDQEFFYSGIQALEKPWTKCISVGGDYVEK